MVYIESPQFCRWHDEFLDDERFSALLATLECNPAAGVPLGHGLYKIRVPLHGRGKRGGGRVIYFYWRDEDRVYLLYGYAKNVQADLTKAQLAFLLRLIREETSDG
jgi:hypothetical protein